MAVAILTVAMTGVSKAEAKPLFTQQEVKILNPIKTLEESEKKKEEQRKQKAEEDRINLLKQTQPWIFRGSGGPNLFAYGYCTWHVKNLRPDINWRGNADRWDENSAKNGFRVSESPSIGTIAVFSRYMHTAYVLGVDGSKVLVSEMNYVGWNRVNQRWIDTREAVYIY